MTKTGTEETAMGIIAFPKKLFLTEDKTWVDIDYVTLLEQKHRDMVAALKFYADEDEYHFCKCGEHLADYNNPCKQCGGETASIMADLGKLARLVLTKESRREHETK